MAYNYLSAQLGTRPQTSTYDYLDAQNSLADLFKKIPKLKSAADLSSSQVTFSDPQKDMIAGENQLEYWPPQEEGSRDYQHPSPGNTALEIFSPELKRNPDLLKQAMFGDLLHGMVHDPKYQLMRHEFSQNFTPEALAMERKNGGLNNSRLDEYIRGYIVGDKNDGFVKDYMAGRPVYSPKQIEILNRMKSYLGS